MTKLKGTDVRSAPKAVKPEVAKKPAVDPKKPVAKTPAQKFGRDELSTGRMSRLRNASFRADGGIHPLGLKADGTSFPSRAGSVSAANATNSAATVAANTAAASVEAAYKKGGAQAAAAQLEAVTRGMAPDMAAAVNAAAKPTIDKAMADLKRDSHKADGHQADHGKKQVAFDQTLADLNISLARGASTAQGKKQLDEVATFITNAIKTDGPGRWDEALGNLALGGPHYQGSFDEKDFASPEGMSKADTGLATAVIGKLDAAGLHSQANDVLQNVAASVRAVNDVTRDLANKVNDFNKDLSQLVHDWAGVMNEGELNAAIDAFKKSHPEYAGLEAFGAGAIRVSDQLSGLSAQVPGLSEGKGLDKTLNDFTDRLPDLAATGAGAEELAKIQEAASLPGAKPGILDRVTSLAAAGKKDAGYLEKLGTQLLKNVVARSMAAKALNDPAAAAAAMKSLSKYGPMLGLDDKQLASFEKLATATTRQEAEKALDEVKKTKAFTGETGLSSAFRGAALILSVGAATGSVANAIDDPNFKNIVSAFSDTIGAGKAGVSFAESFFGASAGLSKAGTLLKGAGQFAAVLSSGFSLFQAAQAGEQGDYAKAALYGAQAIGGLLALSASTGVGAVGAVIVFGAGLAIAQLDKVRASNHFENKHTEAFLEAAGIPHDAAYHLRDADDNGRGVGPEIFALARHMGVDPRALFQAIGQLPPDKVIQFVETMHGLDPNENGEFTPTAANDARVGQRVPMTRGMIEQVQSLGGLATMLGNLGVDIDALPRA